MGTRRRKKGGEYEICDERFYFYWVSGLTELSVASFGIGWHDDHRREPYFSPLRPPAHCPSVAYDCVHCYFYGAVRRWRFLSARRKAASAVSRTEWQRRAALHFRARL